MHALWTHRAALGWAVLCAAACAALAVLVTSVKAVTAWDTGVVLALKPVVVGNPALRCAATVATTVGSPVSVDILTVVVIVIAWLRCAAAKVGRVWAAGYLAVARLVELGLDTGMKNLVDSSPDRAASAGGGHRCELPLGAHGGNRGAVRLRAAPGARRRAATGAGPCRSPSRR